MKTGNWLIRIAVSTLFSYAGWWAGAFVGPMTAFMLSTVFGGFGLWYGGRVAYSILG